MHYGQYFPPYAAAIDSFLDKFFEQKIRQAKRITPVASGMWEHFRDFIAGGKRIRGGLVKLGYECFKKVDEERILPVSAAIEILHAALSLHDDVIDQSETRHGHPTVHKQYESYHRENYQKGLSWRYGENMAIVVGILADYEAVSFLSTAKFPADCKIQAINELCRFVEQTGYGEGLDVDLAQRETLNEKEVLTIHALKTAQYTFVGPLKIGGILVGADEEQLKRFEDYGIPVGVAFQLQDDILGMFGNEEKTGKPVNDDIKEGKNTLLFTQALKKGTSAQRKRLRSLWGKKDITSQEVEEAREIIKKTGSLDYSREMAQKLIEKGKKAVSGITQNTNFQEVFLTLADFVAGREK